MKRHIAYLFYIIKHKWFVYIASKKTLCPLRNVFLHDLSKFFPSEWFPYAETFYHKNGKKRYDPDIYFDIAWLKHQKRNPHHWQYWILHKDNGPLKAIEMPHKYVREMVADWAGAGKAIHGKWCVDQWYKDNEDKIILHKSTKAFVKVLVCLFINKK